MKEFPRGSVVHDFLAFDIVIVYRYGVTPPGTCLRLEKVCNGWRDPKTDDVYPTLDSAKRAYRVANPLVGKIKMEYWRDGELVSQAERMVPINEEGHNRLLDVTF